jgi:hypothetical protein
MRCDTRAHVTVFPRGGTQTYTLPDFPFFASSSRFGYEYASTNVRSCGCWFSVVARTNISTALSMVTEVTTAAVNTPLYPQGAGPALRFPHLRAAAASYSFRRVHLRTHIHCLARNRQNEFSLFHGWPSGFA